LIATGSLRATWLPEGLNKSFVCTHILKISYEQLFVSFDSFFMFFSLFSDSFCILFVSFVHLFWRVNEDEGLKIAGVSFVSRTFSVFYNSFPLIWESLENAARPARTRLPALFSQREGRCSRYGSAIFAHFWCWELTHLF
jgi:hypothetical protein